MCEDSVSHYILIFAIGKIEIYEKDFRFTFYVF